MKKNSNLTREKVLSYLNGTLNRDIKKIEVEDLNMIALYIELRKGILLKISDINISNNLQRYMDKMSYMFTWLVKEFKIDVVLDDSMKVFTQFLSGSDSIKVLRYD
jgi:hypothetical protein